MKWFILLMLFSGVVQAITAQQLIDKYGKGSVASIITERSGGELTIYFNDEFKRAHRASPEYINSRTITIDFSRLGLTAGSVEKIIIKREEGKQQKLNKEKIERAERSMRMEIQEKIERKQYAQRSLDEKRNYKPPKRYRSTIQNYLNNSLFDPYSIRDLSISKPIKKMLKDSLKGLKPGQIISIVFVSYNAKNRFGGYTGKKKYGYIFRGEQLISVTK